MSLQDGMDLTDHREPQNPIQDNMENYRKLLSLGRQAYDATHRAFCHLVLSNP